MSTQRVDALLDAYSAQRGSITRAKDAEDLLREFLEIAGVTHKYPIQGGHDTIGVNLTCAGCELAGRVRTFLEVGR